MSGRGSGGKLCPFPQSTSHSTPGPLGSHGVGGPGEIVPSHAPPSGGGGGGGGVCVRVRVCERVHVRVHVHVCVRVHVRVCMCDQDDNL